MWRLHYRAIMPGEIKSGPESGLSDPRERLRQALYELARDAEGRSKMARVREVMDGIEAALRSGVRRERILATLHEHGIEMTINSFQSALYRIRRERKQQEESGSTSVSDVLEESNTEPIQSSDPTRLPDEPEGLSRRERRERRERIANQYIGSNNPLENPLLKKL